MKRLNVPDVNKYPASTIWFCCSSLFAGNNHFANFGFKQGIQFYEQALVIGRELGDRRGEGHTLWYMSLALDRLGWRAQAIQQAEQALVIGEQIEDPVEDPEIATIRSQLAAWREETNPN